MGGRGTWRASVCVVNPLLLRESQLFPTPMELEDALVVRYLEQQVAIKVQSPPPEGVAAAAAAEVEWSRRWSKWMAPFAGSSGAAAAVSGDVNELVPLSSGPQVGTGISIGAAAAVRAGGGDVNELVLLSSGPQVWACPNFCSATECEALIQLGARADRVTRGSGWSPEWRCVPLSSSPTHPLA
jgi:hypothetical protein